MTTLMEILNKSSINKMVIICNFRNEMDFKSLASKVDQDNKIQAFFSNEPFLYYYGKPVRSSIVLRCNNKIFDVDYFKFIDISQPFNIKEFIEEL
ncbi:MAG: hypothetical protein J7L89_02670 [Bacteroidales bacterium]|nr:hypothetical protein [Bacteroidales bacterium]